MENFEERFKKAQSDQDRRFKLGKITAYEARIIELDDKVPLAQHWHTILRSKGGKESYYWDNDKLLGRIEEYYKEYRKIVEDRFDNLDGSIDEDFLTSRVKKTPTVYGDN